MFMMFFPESFIQVFAQEVNNPYVIVRARLTGDIERLFPNALVSRSAGDSDQYRFSAVAHSSDVIDAFRRELMKHMAKTEPEEITSLSARDNAYGSVWCQMRYAQAREYEKECDEAIRKADKLMEKCRAR